MTIETKYNIGDEVWFMFGGTPYQSKILGIHLYSTTNFYYCVSILQSSGTMDEHLLFPTNEELLKSL